LGYDQAARLLRRCLFGLIRGEIQAAAASGLTAVLNGLLTAPAAISGSGSGPNLLLDEFVRLLVPLTLTASQLAFLKNALIPGLPDFEWTVEWSQYLSARKNAALAKLQAMLKALAGLAEYHQS